jgi:murein DD-endopeptidase MepM/ murein hydrolase activator NlpD
MKKRLITVIFSLFFALTPGLNSALRAEEVTESFPVPLGSEDGITWEQADITYPNRVVSGTVLGINVRSGSREGFTAVLRDSKGQKVSANSSFPVSSGEASEEYLYESILLGIPSTISSASCLLGLEQQGTLLWEGPVQIVAGDFRRDEIPLNQSMSQLHSDPDPRKVEEAVMIQQIYATFNRRPWGGALQFELPVKNGRFSAMFGDRRVFIYDDGKRAASVHSGLDIAAPTGTEIKAGASGLVILATDRIVTGKTVVIEHLPGVYGVFFHLDSMNVDTGYLVEGDTVIGTVGMTGLATGPHLHWEIRVGSVPVDPFIYISRSLPLLPERSLDTEKQ